MEGEISGPSSTIEIVNQLLCGGLTVPHDAASSVEQPITVNLMVDVCCILQVRKLGLLTSTSFQARCSEDSTEILHTLVCEAMSPSANSGAASRFLQGPSTSQRRSSTLLHSASFRHRCPQLLSPWSVFRCSLCANSASEESLSK